MLVESCFNTVTVEATSSKNPLRLVDVVQIVEYKIGLVVHGLGGDIKLLICGDEKEGSWTVKSDAGWSEEEGFMYSTVLERTLSIPALISLF
jgi:hypothetical protein